MKKQYRPWTPQQSFLLPPSMLDWLPEGHLALFILDVVGELDVSAIDDAIGSKDARGTRPYDPTMMLSLLVYAYCTGIYSSRRLARHCVEDVAFRVLSGNQLPHFTTINEFRRLHSAALAGLFVQVLKLCARAGLVKLGHVALDGSKIQGNASKRKAMSYGRMAAEEARLQAEVKDLLGRAEATDADEDRTLGAGRGAEDVPAELKRREDRLARIRTAREALEAEAREHRAQLLRERAGSMLQVSATHEDPAVRKRTKTRAARNEEKAAALVPAKEEEPPASAVCPDEGAFPAHRARSTSDGKPTASAQYNFTDSESRIMKRDGTYLQGYNCQVAVDDAYQVIVAKGVSNVACDASHWSPLLVRMNSVLGRLPTAMTADSGYLSAANVAFGETRGVAVYIAVGRQRHGEEPENAEVTRCADAQTVENMRLRLATDEGRATYARRKAVVEPVFGQIKGARGFRQFSRRGMLAVRNEWGLLCACHNLLKLYRYGRRTTEPDR